MDPIFQLKSDPHFATNAIHVGQEPEQWSSRAIVPPISMSSIFKQKSAEDNSGYFYSRMANPTRDCLERCIASLEKGKYGLCFASGVTAVDCITHNLKSGEHVICGDDVYGGTNEFFRVIASRMGIDASYVDPTNPLNIKKAIKPTTRLVWVETPTNPTLKVVDIAAVAKILKEYKEIMFVVDNTFMTPYFQQPLTLGADVVVHSLSKYMNGHADIVMGALVTNDVDIYEKLKYVQITAGLIPSPFDCYLVNRGLKTLHLRMKEHMRNGMAVAKFLESHPCVTKVIFPGLPSHPQHELAKKQCSGMTGMVSFHIKGGLNEAEAFLSKLKVITLSGSLGSTGSLAELPAIMTHAAVPKAERLALGMTDSFIRLSIGLESTEDILNDLDQALKSAVGNF